MVTRFVAHDLASLDGLQVDALALPFFEDERPLRGVGALVDWRLCGGLSQWLLKERIQGVLGEQTLVSTAKKFLFERTFLMGCGSSAQWNDERASRVLRQCCDVLEATASRSCGLTIPGRSMELWGVEQAWALLQAELSKRTFFAEVVVLDTPAATRYMQEASRELVSSQRARRGLMG